MSHVLEPVGETESSTTPAPAQRTRRARRRLPASRHRGWIIRGVVLAVIHSAARVTLGITTDLWPLHSGALRWGCSAAVVLIAIVWGIVDGRPRRGGEEGTDSDTTFDWLRAGLFAAVLAAGACIGLAGVEELHLAANGAIFELTSGVGWTFLLIFLPAMIGVALRRLVRSRTRTAPTSP